MMIQDIFIDRLKKTMAANQVNARELSKRCGLSEGAISRYLSGKMEPRIPAIEKMAEALHVDPVWLMGLDGTSMDYRMDLSKKTTSMALLIENMTPSEQDQVDTYIKFLINLRGGNKDES